MAQMGDQGGAGPSNLGGEDESDSENETPPPLE